MRDPPPARPYEASRSFKCSGRRGGRRGNRPAHLDTTHVNAYTRSVSSQELIFISVAARLVDMHPQTLRKYERLGLVRPARTLGSMRLYSAEQIERLRFIKRLVEDEGVNLAGVQHLLAVAELMQRIRPLLDEEVIQRDGLRRRKLLRELARINQLCGLDEA